MNGKIYIVRIYRRETRADGQRASDRVRLAVQMTTDKGEKL